MTSSATVRGGQQWTRSAVTIALQQYVQAHGLPVTAACFSPSAAKWGARLDLVERYRAGNPITGDPWPALNSIKAPFDGSFNAALDAAGIPRNPSGPGKRAANKHAPIRDLPEPPRQRVIAGADPAELRAERRRADRAERQVAGLRDRAEAASMKTKAAREALDAARARAREARTAATRMAARLERAEATIATLRGERRELRDDLAAARRIAEAAAADVKVVRVPVERVVTKTVVKTLPAPEQAVIDAVRERERAAVARARAAERRADEADAAYLELVEAVDGSRRRLAPGEIEALRARGPAGPAVLADALKRLARARAAGGTHDLGVALRRVASAAVSWQERL
jgi:hypothetical protein